MKTSLIKFKNFVALGAIINNQIDNYNLKQIILILMLVFFACNHITNGNRLTKSDIQLIQKLGLLDKDETIIKFYSEYKNNVAGNFFTNKRIASYWQDENDKTKNEVNSAYYRDIISIDTCCYSGATFSPYLLVLNKDSSSFKAYFDGEQREIIETFNEAISEWQENKLKN